MSLPDAILATVHGECLRLTDEPRNHILMSLYHSHQIQIVFIKPIVNGHYPFHRLDELIFFLKVKHEEKDYLVILHSSYITGCCNYCDPVISLKLTGSSKQVEEYSREQLQNLQLIYIEDYPSFDKRVETRAYYYNSGDHEHDYYKALEIELEETLYFKA